MARLRPGPCGDGATAGARRRAEPARPVGDAPARLRLRGDRALMPRAVVTGGAGFLGSHLCDALLARGWEVVAVDDLSTGARENVTHLLGRSDFQLLEHDVVHGLPDRRPRRRGAALREPGEPARVPLASDRHARGRVDRNAARARAGAQARGRAVPPRVHQRGLWRPARAPAVRGVLGEREPRRSPVGVRRGEAVRRGDHDGVPPHARARHQDREDLQHLRPSIDAGRRASGVELPGAGDARRAAHRVRRRQPDPFVLLRRRRGRRHHRACSSRTTSGR